MNRFVRTAIAVALAAAAGVLVTTTSATARVVAATPPQSVALTSSATDVSTSTGRHLVLQVSATKFIGSTRPVDLSVALGNGALWQHGETHSWNFQLDRSDLRWDRGSGRVELRTHSDLGRFGALRLVFRPKQRRLTSCDLGAQTIHRGTLRGHLAFDTQSAAWGTVGHPKSRFSFSTQPLIRVVVDRGCLRGDYGERAWCADGVQWGRPIGTTADSISGVALRVRGQRIRQLVAVRRTHIAHPSGAYRFDQMLLKHEPAPAVVGPRLHLHTKSGTPARGSASIGRGRVSRSSSGCDGTHGARRQQLTVNHRHGRFLSHHFRFLFHVGGAFRLGNGHASWTVTSVS